MIKKIEKRPPTLTGDPSTDIRLLAEYMDYVREQTNYLLAMVDRKLNEGGTQNNG